MPWTTAYRMQFNNVEGVEVSVIIYDTTSLVGPPTGYIDMPAADDPFHLFTTDNDEDIFSPIKALQAEIRFYSSSTLNLSTFFTDDDNRWQVEAYVGGTLHFIGFLVLDDIDEDFLDSDTKNVITLIASDNLGKQRDQALLTMAGENPRGYYTLAQYVAMVLYQTGLQLNINICHNVKEENAPTQILYRSSFLDAKTFEKDINKSVDGYTALEMILGEDSFLTQYLGEWWVVRLDEVTSAAGVKNVFDYSGAYLSSSAVDLTKTFGPLENIFFSDKATFVKPKQPLKELILTYRYEFPQEIIDNIDFDRDGLTPFYSASFVDTDGLTKVRKRYPLEDWTIGRFSANTPTTVGATGSTAYIERIFLDDYEQERYVVVTYAGTETNPYTYLRCNPIYLDKKDKGTVSVDFRYSVNTVGNNVNPMAIILKGDNGTNYYALNNSGEWFNATSFGTNFFFSTAHTFTSATQKSEWQTVSIELAPLPVGGDLYVFLVAGYNNGGSGNPNAQYQNLQFNYQPYINGSYAKYQAQHHKISQDINSKKIRDNRVDISDSPKRLFKGALRRYNGTNYPLIDQVYDGILFGSTVPDAAFLHPFGFNQAWSVWNKNNRSFRIFDFKAQGLDSSGSLPSLIHRITIDEVSPHTTDKFFMIVHYDMDMKLCEIKGVLCEIDDTNIANSYDEDYEFKYISER